MKNGNVCFANSAEAIIIFKRCGVERPALRLAQIRTNRTIETIGRDCLQGGPAFDTFLKLSDCPRRQERAGPFCRNLRDKLDGSFFQES